MIEVDNLPKEQTRYTALMYRDMSEQVKNEDDSHMKTYMRGIKAGLNLALWNARILTRNIRSKKKRGFHLVWVSEDEYQELKNWHPKGGERDE